MSIQNALNTTIYDALTGASALTDLLAGTTSAYFLQAPDDSPLDYVVWSHQGGGPENVNPSDLRNIILWIRGYSGTASAAGSIDSQISTLIDGVALSVSGYTNFWTVRQQAVSLVENLPDGRQVYTSGAFYQIRLDS